jgi:putative copper export protein
MIDSLSIVLRALGFIAMFQACGMAMFQRLFGRHLHSGLERPLRRTAIATTIAAMLLVAAHFALEPARMGGEFAAIADSALQDLTLHSALAVAFTWRMAGLVLLLTSAFVATGSGQITASLGITMVLAAFTQVGHTASFAPRLALAALLLVHLAIVAFWFGALLPLRGLALSDRTRASVTIEAFSRLAMWLVPLLFIAGLGMTAMLVRGWHALLTPYGGLLLLKSALFAVLMLLAALNKWRYSPALARDASAARAFSRTVLVEYLLMAAVLSVTATLTTLYSPDP